MQNRFLKMYIEISLMDQNISIAENGIKSTCALCMCVLHMDISIIFQLWSPALFNWMGAFIFLAPLDWNGGTALHLSVPMVKVCRCPLMIFFPITETCALLMVSWLNMLISFYVILFLTFPPLQRKIQLRNNLIVKRSSIIHSFSQTLEQIIVIFVMPLVFVV